MDAFTPLVFETSAFDLTQPTRHIHYSIVKEHLVGVVGLGPTTFALSGRRY